MRLRRGTFKYTLSVVFITNSGVRIQSKFKTYFNPCIDFRVELFKWSWTFTFAHTHKMTLGTHAHCAQWEHYDLSWKSNLSRLLRVIFTWLGFFQQQLHSALHHYLKLRTFASVQYCWFETHENFFFVVLNSQCVWQVKYDLNHVAKKFLLFHQLVLFF